jgi:hypothetical protein
VARYIDLHLDTIGVSHIIHPPLMEKQKHEPPRLIHGNSIASCVNGHFPLEACPDRMEKDKVIGVYLIKLQFQEYNQHLK